MSIDHCNEKTEVLDTRGDIRTRRCIVCGYKFRTKEIIVEYEIVVKTVADRRAQPNNKEIKCTLSKAELKDMMTRYTSLKQMANELHISTTVLNRWLREFDL